MVLLTILAVGLLTLSSVSLSTSGRESNLAEARANARMALSLAIAQIQKQTGPDQRITMAADQLSSGGNADESAAAAERRHWTGVYNSWTATTATLPQSQRPAPTFRSWLVSGQMNDLEQVDFAKSSSGDDKVRLVGEGTLGSSADGAVDVPAMRLQSGNATPRIAWWTGDQGIKAAVSTPLANPSSALGEVRAGIQTPVRNAVEFAKVGTDQPFKDLDPENENVPKVTDWQQTGLLTGDAKAPRALFHDLAPFSTGLLTNVRQGGFRKDLSMQLERPAATANSTLVSSRTALYKVNGENGINLHELWAYYNMYKPSELKSTGSAKFTTGGNIPSGAKYLQVESGSVCETDDEFFFKQPTIISYQLALSLGMRTMSITTPAQPTATQKDVVCVIVDPIITFWNPLDVPVVVPTASFFSVKYWPMPYSIVVNGQECPLVCCVTGRKDGDHNFASLEIGRNIQLVLKPGEVVKFSQTNGILNKTGSDHNLEAKPGFNFGAGIAYPLRKRDFEVIDYSPSMSVTYSMKANEFTAGATSTSGQTPNGPMHSRHFSLNHNEVYVGEDRDEPGYSLGYGGMFIDWDFGNRRLKPGEDRGQTNPGSGGTKPGTDRLRANNLDIASRVFKPLTSGRTLSGGQLAGTKSPIAIISFNAKTEAGTDPDKRTRYLSRFNPRAHFFDFYDLSEAELAMSPYEFTMDPLNSWKNRSIESSSKGEGYFGGGMNAEFGVNAVVTHSIPREPIVSLAALQHSFANGFEILRPKNGYAILNSREPMQPQISHAIGNSVAPAMLGAAAVEGSLKGNRPLADHSYLANNALWDDWYFSGITPQTGNTFSKSRAQKTVAEEFLNGTGKLPVVRYLPDAGGIDVQKFLASVFSGANPTDNGTKLTATAIRVDGLFNVNSTSVEAWKALFGGLKGRSVVIQGDTGSESLQANDKASIPVPGLLTPQNQIADGKGSAVTDKAQWVGRRVLTEKEIDQLARAVVREVRKRGPFLSLSDFINRRPGSDKNLARAGAIQSALDSDEVEINSAFNSGDRAVSQTAMGKFTFPEAEKGASGYGMPGVVKQADILTPIAPVLSARSDSFIVRAYGESVDKDGKILARAWCEAVVERGKEFVDNKGDAVDTPILTLKEEANKNFGRRYKVSSFRWLHPEEV